VGQVGCQTERARVVVGARRVAPRGGFPRAAPGSLTSPSAREGAGRGGGSARGPRDIGCETPLQAQWQASLQATGTASGLKMQFALRPTSKIPASSSLIKKSPCNLD